MEKRRSANVLRLFLFTCPNFSPQQSDVISASESQQDEGARSFIRAYIAPRYTHELLPPDPSDPAKFAKHP